MEDTGNGRKADTVDTFKVYIVFYKSLLYFTQSDGIVLTDHINNESLLLLGEQKTPSTLVLQFYKRENALRNVYIQKQ